MNQERFRFFPSNLHESDLLIGVPHDDFRREMMNTAFEELVRLRNLLLDFSEKYPLFGTSLEPFNFPAAEKEQVAGTNSSLAKGVPYEILSMIECGIQSGTGPMSSVAGMFAERIGIQLIQSYGLREVVVENGGDLFLNIESDAVSVIHAGSSPLSDKMAFVIPPGQWGICTSSGTMGHSFSQGRADAVTVISKSTPLADAWATSLANMVSHQDDIEPVLDKFSRISEISGCAVIIGERIGIRGDFEVKLLS